MPIIQSAPAAFTLAPIEEWAEQAPCRVDNLLLAAEDFMAVKMWNEAAAVLKALPNDAKKLTYVGVVYLDLLIGQEQWQEGLTLAFELLEASPKNAELWLRMARLMAGAGNLDGAHTAAQECLSLDLQYAPFLPKIGLLSEAHRAPERY